MPTRSSSKASILSARRALPARTRRPNSGTARKTEVSVSVSAALQIQVKIANGLRAVPAKRWDALANPCPPSIAGEPVETYNPFVSHAFLSALEDSGCVGGRSGWQPVHILVEAGAGEVVAAAPCYVKSHS